MFPSCSFYGRVEHRVVVAVDGAPPGGHAVDELAPVHQFQAHPFGGRHRPQGLAGVGRGIGMPEMGTVQAPAVPRRSSRQVVEKDAGKDGGAHPLVVQKGPGNNAGAAGRGSATGGRASGAPLVRARRNRRCPGRRDARLWTSTASISSCSRTEDQAVEAAEQDGGGLDCRSSGRRHGPPWRTWCRRSPPRSPHSQKELTSYVDPRCRSGRRRPWAPPSRRRHRDRPGAGVSGAW